MASARVGGALAGLASCSFAWCQMAAATVWTKVKGSFEYLVCKDYSSAKTVEERDSSRNTRSFLSISSLGLGAMCCGGASQVFEHVKTNHPKQAVYCVAYLTFTVLCQLIGLITTTFPSDFRWAYFVAGLGEWQSAVFVLVLFHLNAMEFYGECNAVYSMAASSLIVSFYYYRSVCPSDHWILHFVGKLLTGTFHILCIVICWTLFLMAKFLAFMVWFPFFLFGIILSYGGYSKSPRRKGPDRCDVSAGIFEKIR